MSDIGTKKTDKEIAKLEKELEEVYSDAKKDILNKINDFNSKFLSKDKIHMQELKEGKITQQQYDNWLAGQVFQSEQWASKKKQIIDVMTSTNKVAVNIVNHNMYGVFAFNGNYQAYDIEKGFGINFGFGLYDASTVINLIKNDPQILPKWKIDEKKDYIWNQKKVNNAITQGIIQGENLDKIADRLSTGLCAQNKNTMKTFARTGMTQAQNAGRYQRQMDAKKLGINMVKEWMSTLDGRTRDSHRHMDGEQIKVGDKWHPQKFSNGLRYPGDPEGDPREVYNCRCTLVADLVDYPAEYERYDNIDGKPIKNMTYDEWAKAKGGVEHTRTKYTKKETTTGTSKIDYSKYGGKEVYDIMEKHHFDYYDFISDGTDEEFDILYTKSTKGISEIKGWFKAAEADAKKMPIKKTPAVETKAPKKPVQTKTSQLKKAQQELDDLKHEIDAKGADKLIRGIWSKPVSYADWEEKKDTIETRRKAIKDKLNKDILDREAQLKAKIRQRMGDKTDEVWEAVKSGMSRKDLEKLYGAKYNGPFLVWSAGDYRTWYDSLQYTMGDLRKKAQAKLDILTDFEIHGKEYSQLLSKRDSLLKTINELVGEGNAKPRTADYIAEVTNKAISNYGSRVKNNIDSSLGIIAGDLNLSKEEAKEAMERGLSKIIEHSDFTMRIKSGNLEKVLSEGYFKNQFETGSSGGCLNPSKRKKLENAMFNVPIDGIVDGDRPVYGMFCPIYDENSNAIKNYYANGAGSWYGDGVTVVLKKDNVINNATMTIGDSLDYEGRLVGTEVNNIIYAGDHSRGYDMYKIGTINDSSTSEEITDIMMDIAHGGDSYFEYQLHGKETHSIDNIERVIINKDTAERNPRLLKKLDDAGIEYIINDA